MMIDYGLKNKVVLITGANNPQGIGATTALLFAREGAKVVLVYKKIVEVNRRRNRKSPRYTLIRDRSGREKSWFLQGNACQGNSSKLQSLTAGVCRTFTGMQS
jgi:NAD(P)-dependent dehydrogenase (short-subunit alcohol dehydrogenase family)